MANSVIGALRVNLGLDSAQFTNGLKKGHVGLHKFASVAKAGFAAVGAAGLAMAAALVVGMRSTINTADELTKSAQKFGIPVEELSRMKHAADLSGVSLETLGKGMQRLSRNMFDAEMGLKAPQRAFDALGISIRNTDGTMKTSSEIMTEVAGRFSTMKDGVEKTALAMTLFGRAGAELIPMFNSGAEGLAAMMAEADALGITLDEKTGRAAEAFNDNLTRIGRVKDGLILKITAQMLPTLEMLSVKFLGVANNGELIEHMASGVVKALGFIANSVAQVAILSQRLRVELAGLGEAFQRINNWDFSGGLAAFRESQAKSAQMSADMKAEIDKMFSNDRVSDAYIQMRLDQAFGKAGETAAEEFVVNFENASRSSGVRIKAAIDPMAQEAARIFEATRTPLEQYQAQIARLNELLAAGALNHDTYNRAVMQAQDAFDQAEAAAKKSGGVMESVGNTLTSTFSSAFQGLIDGSKKVKDVLRDLMNQFAGMAMNSVFKSLIGGVLGGGGGFLSSIFSGFRADGGPVSAGRAYVVGERGPELMVPSSSGTVISNRAMMQGGGGTSTVVVQLSPGLTASILQEANQGAVKIVQSGIGEYDKAIPGRFADILARSG